MQGLALGTRIVIIERREVRLLIDTADERLLMKQRTSNMIQRAHIAEVSRYHRDHLHAKRLDVAQTYAVVRAARDAILAPGLDFFRP